jgi:methionyl-tRNA formyltransferase
LRDSSDRPRKLKIFSATVADLSERPGRTFIVEKEIVITAGDRAISLGEVQLEGKRRMSAAEFLRGHAMSIHIA